MSNIWTAAGEGNFDRVRELVESGTSPAVQDENSYTALHAASSWNHPEILRYLVSERGADINTTDDDGETCLFVCETVDMARLIIEELRGDASHRNNEGLTAANSLEEDYPEVAAYLRSVTGEPAPVATVDPDGQAFDEEAQQQPQQRPDLDAPTDEILSRVRQVMQASERGELSEQETETRLREIVTQVVHGQVDIGRVIGQAMEARGSAAGTIRPNGDGDERDSVAKRTRPDEAGR
ncbi:hypothetical protein OIV83_002556 [Microbotryomycetes sp. JL201]|nr:hypothetical protein OIV83_002556 [Microbotryomycetes sp. JL201]